MPPFVLIQTVGRNDIHVIGEDNGGNKFRCELEGRSVRSFHQACLDGTLRWKMLPFAESVKLKKGRGRFRFDPGTGSLTPEQAQDGLQLHLPEGGAQVLLSASLLAETWELIEARRVPSNLGKCLGVLLLYTDRRDGPEGEPIAVGFLAKEVVCSAFGVEESRFHDYCFHREGDLYEADCLGQQLLNRAAADSIDRAIREFADNCGMAKPVVFISDVGGLPEVKSVVAASVDFHFRGNFEYARPTERRATLRQLGEAAIPPAESLALRSQVWRLLERGCFDAAAALVRHPRLGEEVYQIEPWREAVRQVHYFLQGKQLEIPENAGTTGTKLRRLAEENWRSLVVAFRIEAALRHDDLETAICDTVTLGELAFFELLEKHCSQDGQSCIDWDKTKVTIIRATASAALQRSAIWNRDEAKHGVLKKIDDVHRELLTPCLPEPSRTAWTQFFSLPDCTRTARNLAVHARVSMERLNAVKEILCTPEREFWRQTGAGLRFLIATRANTLLSSLGWNSEPAELYQDLLAALRDDLGRGFPPRDQAPAQDRGRV